MSDSTPDNQERIDALRKQQVHELMKRMYTVEFHTLMSTLVLSAKKEGFDIEAHAARLEDAFKALGLADLRYDQIFIVLQLKAMEMLPHFLVPATLDAEMRELLPEQFENVTAEGTLAQAMDEVTGKAGSTLEDLQTALKKEFNIEPVPPGEEKAPS